MAVVLFLIDAMRHDYITEHNTPFLWRCGQEGKYYKHVIPSFGFCERTEILTGLTPKESGFFTAIGFDPENSPFKSIKFLQLFESIENYIPRNISVPGIKAAGSYYRYYRALMSILFRNFSEIRMNSYHIPFTLLPYFNLTEDRIDHREKGAFPVASILELLENRELSYYYDSFTALNLPPNGSDNDRLNMALEAAGSRKQALYLIFIGEFDAIGHKYGPESHQMTAALKKVDKSLKDFVSKFEDREPDSKYLFLGDHGMVPITEVFDAKQIISDISKKLGLKFKKDFIYFLDSTLVRLWFFSDRGKLLFPAALKESDKFNQCGKFIDERIAQKYHIPWGDRRYGDMTWWADSGVLVYPDFFHNDGVPYKGMHGYSPELPESQGGCIVYGHGANKMEIDSIRLTYIFDILKETLRT